MSSGKAPVRRAAERQALAEQVAATLTDEVIRLREVLESTACPTCQGVGRVPDLPFDGAEECPMCRGRGDLSRYSEPTNCGATITHRDEDHRQSVCGLLEGHNTAHDGRDGCVWTDGEHWESEVCHCGGEPLVHESGFTRGLCRDCDAVRCDAYPGECGR